MLPGEVGDSLNNFHPKALERPKNLLRETQACGINSILLVLQSLGHGNSVTVEELVEIFDYDSDGITLQQYRFQKLNELLDKREIPYRFHIRKFTSLQELLGRLSISSVPVVFWMKVLRFTPRTHRDCEYQVRLGEVHESDNHHILLMTGLDNESEHVYFLDPSYQIPFLNPSIKSLEKHSFPISKNEFYESASGLKTYLEVSHSTTSAKRYKKAALKRIGESARQRKLA